MAVYQCRLSTNIDGVFQQRFIFDFVYKERGPAYPTSLSLGAGKNPRIQTMRRQAHVYT